MIHVIGKGTITSQCVDGKGKVVEYYLMLETSAAGKYSCAICKVPFGINVHFHGPLLKCLNCGRTERRYLCDSCYSSQKTSGNFIMTTHNRSQTCSSCEGEGLIEVGPRCSHKEAREHTYCEHNGKTFMTQHD